MNTAGPKLSNDTLNPMQYYGRVYILKSRIFAWEDCDQCQIKLLSRAYVSKSTIANLGLLRSNNDGCGN